MIRLSASPADLERAAGIIKAGGIVAFPTETVYGLGADAFNTQALARVFEAKGRPRFDPLIIHIAGMEGLYRIADFAALSPGNITLLEKCAAAFWPGPLTFVIPKGPEVPDLATAGLPAAAVRFPSHPAARELIRLTGLAVAAPSANPFGRLSPTRAEHVIESLGEKIDAVVDGGPCSVGVESTVLDISGEVPRILRPGGISREQLEALIGPVFGAASGPVPSALTSAAPSPGMLKSHYAPNIPLVLHSPEEMAALPFSPDEGFLFFSGKNRDLWLQRNHREGTACCIALSKKGDTMEAAANLFDCLHRLDNAETLPEEGFPFRGHPGLRRIHAETLPEEGLGAAVNDRLRRAAALS
ncbi:threonylcarbamoyl-AMP synthase [Spirochaetia bacterium]|nr:threonylcarbamoyl-AMP synthase [Spirochaetia bacterium]